MAYFQARFFESTNKLKNSVFQKNVHLWWPNGFGGQPLYTLNATFKSLTANETSSKEIKIGIRTVELVQEKLLPNLEGLSFYFKVNDVPIFAKGSNWIPGHILPEKGYDESIIKNALLSAKEANMNALRVWGGCVYESDLFYQVFTNKIFFNIRDKIYFFLVFCFS